MYTLSSGINNSHYHENVESFKLYRDALAAYEACNSPVKVIFKLKHNKRGELTERTCKQFQSEPGACNTGFLKMIADL